MKFPENIHRNLETIASKEKLKEMESSGNFVFHGSPHSISEFEPRQAYTDDVAGKSTPDGEPAVFASPEIEIPIFRSIFHEDKFSSLKGNFKIGFSGIEEGEPFVEANQAAIDASQNHKGYVYVFEKRNFVLRGGKEWISKQKVRPCAVFHSAFQDIGLPIKKLD